MAPGGARFDLHQQGFHLGCAGLHVLKHQPVAQHIGLPSTAEFLQCLNTGWIPHLQQILFRQLLQQALRLYGMRRTAGKGLSECRKCFF